MMKARTINSARNPSGFQVINGQKSDGFPPFCVEYRALNKPIKEDKFPVPKVEEVIYNMAGAKAFGNWIRLLVSRK